MSRVNSNVIFQRLKLAKETKQDAPKVVPMDCNRIANILAGFLRVEPEVKPIILSSDNLRQLLDVAKSTINNDACLLECIGSIYAIALFHANSPNFDDYTFLESFTLLQAIFVECIVVMQASGCTNFDIIHPSDAVDHIGVTIAPMYEVFLESLELSKEFLREITYQVRTVRDPPKKETRYKIHPIDCFQPHALYFICSFAIAHIAAVLKSRNKLHCVPGIVETLVGDDSSSK